MAQMVGGFTDTKEKDDDVQNIINQVRAAVEEKLNEKNPYERFEVKQYKSQVVAGTNYLVKVQVGDEAFIHLKVYVPLPHTNQPPQLSEAQSGKKEDDELLPL